MTAAQVASRLREIASEIDALGNDVIIHKCGAAGDTQHLILALHFDKTPPGIIEAIRRGFASSQMMQTNQLTLFFE